MSVDGNSVLLFDLYHSGHHLQYLTYLLQHWLRVRPPGRLDVAVPEAVTRNEDRFMTVIESGSAHGVQLHPLPIPPAFGRPGTRGLVFDDLEHGRQLRRLVRELRPDHALLMYFDQAQLSLALDLRFTSSVSFSGIYFRPSFHYPVMTEYQPALRERATNLRKQLMLRAALRNPHFRFLFSLDPFVIEHLNHLPNGVELIWLPDGADCIERPMTSEAFRSRWSIEPHRTLVSLFGVLDRRKGVLETARAVPMLSHAHQSQLCLALFGPLDRADAELMQALDAIEKHTQVQMIVEDRFLQHDEGQQLLGASDLIVLPYRRHVGSSNVLVRAACAQRPVLGSDYGTLGMQIRKNKLGRTIPTDQPEHIAKALASFLNDPASIHWDPVASRSFARANSSDAFAATIFDRLLSQPQQATGVS